MNLDDYKNFSILKEYFNENCKDLIFFGEQKIETNKIAKMYYLDTNKITEKNNYKKVFQEYLVLYARSYEKLRYIKINNEKISEDLIAYGKDTWGKKGYLLNKNIETLGIFGELFNDFYLNIVKDEHILLTYSNRHGFSERNVKGVDVVGCTCENKKLTMIFSECKFVADISSATTDLYEDIKGKNGNEGHISKQYINEFSEYLIDKGHSLYDDSKDNTNIIINTLGEINEKVYNGALPIDVFNDLEVKIRFVFFAIYTDNKYTLAERIGNFNKIINAFNEEIIKTEINNYDIEVVFIPIKNNGVEIKEYMSTWD